MNEQERIEQAEGRIMAIDETHVEETAYLLSSPNNVRRLHEALNRDPKDRIRFDDLGSLRDEVGI